MGQSESGGIFVSAVNCKELMTAGSSILLSYSNGKVILRIFSLCVPKIPGDLLCPAMPVLPHSTLHVIFFLPRQQSKGQL